MRNRNSLVLMEQLIMVLMFALASAMCLQVFVRADEISKETGQRDRAVSLVQNCAELLKIHGGLTENLEAELMGTREADAYVVYYDSGFLTVAETKEAVYRMEICRVDSEVTGLGQARIQMFKLQEDMAPVFSLNVAWQEEN